MCVSTPSVHTCNAKATILDQSGAGAFSRWLVSDCYCELLWLIDRGDRPLEYGGVVRRRDVEQLLYMEL